MKHYLHRQAISNGLMPFRQVMNIVDGIVSGSTTPANGHIQFNYNATTSNQGIITFRGSLTRYKTLR